MNRLLPVTVVLTLAILVITVATGAALAQDIWTPVQGPLQPQVAREVVASWENAHPLEYYLALPVTDYLVLARTPNLANAHPLEYYLAFPVGQQEAQEQYSGMADVARDTGR